MKHWKIYDWSSGKKDISEKVMIIDESVREALSGVMLRVPADSLIMLWKKKKKML